MIELRTYAGFGMRNVSVFWRGTCVFKVSVRTMRRRTVRNAVVARVIEAGYQEVNAR